MNKYDFECYEIKALLNKLLGQNQTPLPENMGSPKSQDPTAVVLANNKDPPLEVGHSTKMLACGLSNMKPAH